MNNENNSVQLDETRRNAIKPVATQVDRVNGGAETNEAAKKGANFLMEEPATTRQTTETSERDIDDDEEKKDETRSSSGRRVIGLRRAVASLGRNRRHRSARATPIGRRRLGDAGPAVQQWPWRILGPSNSSDAT